MLLLISFVTVLVCIVLAECELSTNTTWFFLAESLSRRNPGEEERSGQRAQKSFSLRHKTGHNPVTHSFYFKHYLDSYPSP